MTLNRSLAGLVSVNFRSSMAAHAGSSEPANLSGLAAVPVPPVVPEPPVAGDAEDVVGPGRAAAGHRRGRLLDDRHVRLIHPDRDDPDGDADDEDGGDDAEDDAGLVAALLAGPVVGSGGRLAGRRRGGGR